MKSANTALTFLALLSSMTVAAQSHTAHEHVPAPEMHVIAALQIPPRLPSALEAKELLNTTPRHREWVRVAAGSETVFAFVVYPDRLNKAPVVVIHEQQEVASTWARAVADQAALAGFIAVVPDAPVDSDAAGGESRRPIPATRIQAVRAYAESLPAADGRSAEIVLDKSGSAFTLTADQVANGNRLERKFALSTSAWAEGLALLADQLGDRPAFAGADTGHMHNAMLAQSGGLPGAGTSYAEKKKDIPAGYYTADATLAASPRRSEWINLDVGGVKVRTWVVYPDVPGKVGSVVVMQHGTGMDNWVRAVADQIAQSGFIAISPDLWWGTAPDGGGIDSSKYLDDAMLAGRKISPDEGMRRYVAARNYALGLPESNGKTASLGFCMGGSNSFRFAAEVPELNAAVVFYGGSPDEATLAKIKAPVLGLYGENDARVVESTRPAKAFMDQNGKRYEVHVYPKATHSFMLFQEIAGNPAAVQDAWPRAMRFLKENLE